MPFEYDKSSVSVTLQQHFRSSKLYGNQSVSLGSWWTIIRPIVLSQLRLIQQH